MAEPVCPPNLLQALMAGPHIYLTIFAEDLLCVRHLQDSRQLLSPRPDLSPPCPTLRCFYSPGFCSWGQCQGTLFGWYDTTTLLLAGWLTAWPIGISFKVPIQPFLLKLILPWSPCHQVQTSGNHPTQWPSKQTARWCIVSGSVECKGPWELLALEMLSFVTEKANACRNRQTSRANNWNDT